MSFEVSNYNIHVEQNIFSLMIHLKNLLKSTLKFQFPQLYIFGCCKISHHLEVGNCNICVDQKIFSLMIQNGTKIDRDQKFYFKNNIKCNY